MSASADWRAESIDIVRCPACCGTVALTGASATCSACGKRAAVSGNVLDWRGAFPEPVRDTPSVRNRLRRAANWAWERRNYFHIFHNPLSPLAWVVRWRTERYYRRTLSDSKLAAEWFQHYLPGVTLSPGATALDHGCGRGRNVGLLGQLGFRVMAQDLSPRPWWSNLRGCGFQLVPPVADRLPWASGAFELVSDVSVIYQIPAERLQAFFAEIARIIRPGGHWLVIEGNTRSYNAAAMRRDVGRLHDVDAIRAHAINAGFEAVSESYEGLAFPVFSTVLNGLRKFLSPWPYQMEDYRSSLARLIPPERRQLCAMVFRRLP